MAKFTLTTNRWFGWQMLPGYSGERCIPYCSPIYIQEVTPLKSGNGILNVSFWNTGYAEGLQDFESKLRVIHRAADFLIAEILYGSTTEDDRCAIISHIEFGWIERFCPYLWHANPPYMHGTNAETSVSAYLNSVFNIKE